MDYIKLDSNEDGRWVLVFDTVRAKSLPALLGRGLQGGGPTWLNVIEARIARDAPHYQAMLDFNDDAETLIVQSTERSAVELVNDWIAAYEMTPDSLIEFIDEVSGDHYID